MHDTKESADVVNIKDMVTISMGKQKELFRCLRPGNQVLGSLSWSLFCSIVYAIAQWVHPCRKRKKTTFYTSVGSTEINIKMARSWAAERAQACPNLQHHASVLPEPKLSNKGWMTDKSSPAIIVQKSPKPWSNMVKTDQYFPRKYRRQLVKTPTPASTWRKKREMTHSIMKVRLISQ